MLDSAARRVCFVNDLGTADGPEAPDQAHAERSLGHNRCTAGRFSGSLEENHELDVRVSWRCRIVDRDEINPGAIRGAKRQPQSKKIRGSFCVRAAQSGRDSSDAGIFQAGPEQADPIQIFG